jgi:hypothetical protein
VKAGRLNSLLIVGVSDSAAFRVEDGLAIRSGLSNGPSLRGAGPSVGAAKRGPGVISQPPPACLWAGIVAKRIRRSVAELIALGRRLRRAVGRTGGERSNMPTKQGRNYSLAQPISLRSFRMRP